MVAPQHVETLTSGTCAYFFINFNPVPASAGDGTATGGNEGDIEACWSDLVCFRMFSSGLIISQDCFSPPIPSRSAHHASHPHSHSLPEAFVHLVINRGLSGKSIRLCHAYERLLTLGSFVGLRIPKRNPKVPESKYSKIVESATIHALYFVPLSSLCFHF